MRHYHVNRRDEEWRRRHNNKRRFPNPLPQQGTVRRRPAITVARPRASHPDRPRHWRGRSLLVLSVFDTSGAPVSPVQAANP